MSRPYGPEHFTRIAERHFVRLREITLKTDPDCPTCQDTGRAEVGREFAGSVITAPCPDCGLGEDPQ